MIKSDLVTDLYLVKQFFERHLKSL